MFDFEKKVDEKDIKRFDDGGALINNAMYLDKEDFKNFLLQQKSLREPESRLNVITGKSTFPFSCPPPLSSPRVHPGYSGWGNVGDFNSQGDTWKHDTNISMSGDPTAVNDSDNGKIGLNTGSNHDCNAFWGFQDDAMSRGQVGVRGVYFETEQIGDTKFKPRISGSAMVWKNSSGDIKRESLSFDGGNKAHSHSGTIENLSTSWKSYWGLSKKDDSWFKWADPNYYWAGVVFHYESTWHSGGAVDSFVRIRNLRPILDRDFNETPNNDSSSPYAVWSNFY